MRCVRPPAGSASGSETPSATTSGEVLLHVRRDPMSGAARWLAVRPRRIFAVSFVLLFLALSAWSLATPRMASADEAVHVDKAAALYRGELVGQQTGGAKSAYTIVHLPDFYPAAATASNCFIQKPAIPAGCATPVHWNSTVVPVRIYVGRYPPLYYALVGLPSLFTTSWTTLLLMRLMGDLASAVLLALAITAVAAWSRSRLLLVAVLAAATPTALYFASVVNPSGLEISAAICLWASGLVLVLHRPEDPPRGLVFTVAAAAATLVLVRGLSPLWLLVTAVALVLLGDARQLVRLLWRRDVQIGVGIVGACSVFALAWILGAHSLDLPVIPHALPPGTTTGHIVTTTFGYSSAYIQEMIGQFGYLDTSSPTVTYYAWTGVVAFFVVAGLLAARLRRAVVLGALVVATIVLPVALSVSQTRRQGYGWQGRYALPLAAGVILVAAALADEAGLFRRYPRRTAGVLLVALAVGLVAAFTNTLRRYTVGTASTLDLLKGRWRPPLGDVAVLLWFGVAVVALSVVVFALASRAWPPAPSPPDDEPLDRGASNDEPVVELTGVAGD
jgi:hypothetical protein